MGILETIHKRLRNLVMFVIMDQILYSYETHPDPDSDFAKYHNALIQMKDSADYQQNIFDWVKINMIYIHHWTIFPNQAYYDMTLDGIRIVYLYHYHSHEEGGKFAEDCVERYKKTYKN